MKRTMIKFARGLVKMLLIRSLKFQNLNMAAKIKVIYTNNSLIANPETTLIRYRTTISMEMVMTSLSPNPPALPIAGTATKTREILTEV